MSLSPTGMLGLRSDLHDMVGALAARAATSDAENQMKLLTDRVAAVEAEVHTPPNREVTAAAQTIRDNYERQFGELRERVGRLEHAAVQPESLPEARPAQRPIGPNEWQRIQAVLGIAVDGRKGSATCSAIRQYQRRLHSDETGVLSNEQIETLLRTPLPSGVHYYDTQPCPTRIDR